MEQFEFVSSLVYLEESLTGVPAWWVGLADFGHEGEWVWQVSCICMLLGFCDSKFYTQK